MRLTTLSATVLFALAATTLVLLRPLMPIDETRYVAAAWEMYAGGSALVPHLNGALYAHKPPLLFWLINLVWLMGGVTTLGARLVAPAFAVAAVALTGVLARSLWPDQPWRAGRAALILAVSPLFLLFGSTTMFDSMLSVATLLAMLALWRAARDDTLGPWIGLGAALALGVYAKGPVILIHVLPVALLMPFWRGRTLRADVTRWYRNLGLALLIAGLLVAVWLVPALIAGGADYRTDVLWRQSAGRMVSSFAHRRPWWFFVALLPLMLWPFGWTLRGLASLRPQLLIATAPSRLLGIWFVASLAAFSLISGKQVHYLLPELPALALLLSGASPDPQTRWRHLWLAFPVIAVLLLVLAGWSGLVPSLTKMGFRLPASAALLGCLAAVVGIAGFVRLTGWPVRLAALPLGLMLALHFAARPLLFERYDVTPISRAIASFDGKGIAITDARYPAQFNFAARLRQPVAQPTDPAQISAWWRQHPDGILLSEEAELSGGGQAVGRLPYRSDVITLYRNGGVQP